MPVLYLASADVVLDTSDTLRKHLGTYFYIEPPTTDTSLYGGLENRKLSTSEYTDLRNSSSDGTGGYLTVIRSEADAPKIDSVQTNPAFIHSIDSSVYIPNFKIPMRLYADTDGEVSGDEHWRQYVMGGSFGSENYAVLIDTEKVYYDHSFNIQIPLKPSLEHMGEVDTSDLVFTIHSNYLDYDFYVDEYQKWTSDLDSELLIPNYNSVMDYLYKQTLDMSSESEVIKQQIGHTRAKSTVQNYTVAESVDTDTYLKNQYFGEYFPNLVITPEAKDDLIRYQQNIFFDEDYYNFLNITPGGDAGMEGILDEKGLKINHKLSTFYNIEINFDRHITEEASRVNYDIENLGTTTDEANNGPHPRVMEALTNNDYTARFLELLKDVEEGTNPRITLKNKNYSYDRVTLNPIDGSTYEHESPDEQISLKSFNYLDFLSDAYNNYDQTLNDNFIFMGPPTPAQAATALENTMHNTLNSTNALGVIDRTLDLLNSYTTTYTELLQEYGGAAGDATAANMRDVSEEILQKLYSSNYKLNEVLAYKIEKHGGSTMGDNNNLNLIQKFWMINSENAPEIMKLIDSQVKYGQDYTYKIYAYVAVMGHKYRYGDLRLTKQIGTGDLIDDGTETIEYCVQFYDPQTGQTAAQQFTTVSEEGTDTLSGAARMALSTLSEYNTFADDQVDIVQNPQLADYNLYFEPCLEIVEVPLYQKTLKVLDNPPNVINVVPYHFIDQSNRVGFTIGQDSFIERDYPPNISMADLALNQAYLSSKGYGTVKKFSESPARYVEMYRITKKPNSFTDFAESLVATNDLRIEDNLFNYRDCIMSDKILPNKKYYYVFRLLNENKMPGPLSQIIECELVNDGGYVYSLFDTIDSSEFDPNKTTTKTISFKKLFQLEPHIEQMYFDDSAVNYENAAASEVTNLKVGTAGESLWDKRFKIRLTSKKTAKKLDLNMGFNYRIKDLTKIKAHEDSASWEDVEMEASPAMDAGEFGGGSTGTGGAGGPPAPDHPELDPPPVDSEAGGPPEPVEPAVSVTPPAGGGTGGSGGGTTTTGGASGPPSTGEVPTVQPKVPTAIREFIFDGQHGMQYAYTQALGVLARTQGFDGTNLTRTHYDTLCTLMFHFLQDRYTIESFDSYREYALYGIYIIFVNNPETRLYLDKLYRSRGGSNGSYWVRALFRRYSRHSSSDDGYQDSPDGAIAPWPPGTPRTIFDR
jgi:hypothetical protein